MGNTCVPEACASRSCAEDDADAEELLMPAPGADDAPDATVRAMSEALRQSYPSPTPGDDATSAVADGSATCGRTPAASAAASTAASAAADWVEGFDKLERSYYYHNPRTGETRAERPEGEAFAPYVEPSGAGGARRLSQATPGAEPATDGG